MSSQGLSRRHVVVMRLFVVFLLVLVTTIASSAFEPTARDMRPEGALDVDDTMAAMPRRISPRSTAGPVTQPEPLLRATAVRLFGLPTVAVTATKVDTLFTDVDGDTNADPGDVLQYTVTIGVTGSDATGMMFTDTIDPNTTLVPGSINTSPLAINDSYSCIGNVSILPNAAQGMLANDTDADGNTLTVTGVNTAGTQGQVTFNANGSFTFNPNPGFEGTTTFTYTASDGTATDTGTVTINVSGMIWFVNAAAGAGGDGRIATPFNALTGAGSFNTVATDDPGDNIFLFSGAYTGGFTLLNNQRFLGAGASQTLSAMTGLTPQAYSTALPATGGANPTVTSAGVTVTLGTGNRIQGLSLGNATTSDITGSGFGTLTVRDVTLDGTGRALDLTTGTLDAIFQSISSSTSATNGVILTTVGGSLSSTGGTTVTNATGIGIQVSTAPAGAALNFGNTSITNPDGDTTGNTSVRLIDNTGNVTFGSLTLTPESGQRGLHATHGVAAAAGTITSTSGAITAANGIAVEVNRSTVGTIPLAIALTSVSTNGGSHGVILSNTSGSFTIAGDAGSANNSSGGTIQNHTTYGISLMNAQNVSLDQVTVQNISQNGIDGTGVVNFSFTNGTVFNTGTSGAGQYEENSMAFVDKGVPFDSNTISGNVTVTGSTISQPRRNAVMIETWGGTIGNLIVSNNTFTGGTTTANIADAIHVFSQGSATTTGSITTGKVQNNNISGFKFLSGAIFIGGSGMFIAGGNTSASTLATLGTAANPIEISGNDVDDVGSNGIAVSFNGQQGISNFNIHDNGTMADPMSNMEGLGISVFFGGNGTFSALVNNNAIDNNGPTVNAGSSGIGVQMDQGTALTDAPVVAMTVNNNRVTNPDGTGIRGIARNCAGTMSLKVQNNVVTVPSAANRNGIRIDSGSGAGDTTLCLNMTGNTSAGSGVNQPFGIRKQGTVAGVNEFQINGLVPSPATAAQAAAKVSTDNGAAGVDVLSGDNFVTCTLLKSSNEDADKVEDDRPPTDLRETLIAHHGEAPQRDDVQPLSQEELTWMAGAAMQVWRDTAISAESLAQLEAATFEVRDLPEGQLATREGNRILVDVSAAGSGWYIDQVPVDSIEFDVRVRGRERQTSESSPAFGRYDLLTALTRELGSMYLEGRDRTPKRLRPLMEGLLLPGTRRLPLDKRGELSKHDELANKAAIDKVPVVDSPTAAQPVNLELAVAGGAATTKVDDERSGESITKNIGTVPAGKTVTITFRVTIDTPFPVGDCSVDNQGTVSGSNFANVLTDDPSVAGAANPTSTSIPSPPIIGACPANISVNNTPATCGAVVTFTPPTATGCPLPTVTCVPASGSTFAIGTTTVTCTAANTVLPNATCSFTVTVVDNQAPTLTCPANITQPATAGQCSATVTYTTPTASDNCPGATVSCVPASGGTFPVGVTTVTCTATDASANTGSCSFTITIQDTQAPTVTCPANITAPNTAGLCSATVTYTTPTATDNCPGATVVCAPASGGSFPVGVTTVTCTASDASPNSPDGTCSFTVTIQDTQAPTVTCPANITTGNTAGQCSAVVTYTTPTATDNCPGATVVCVPASGSTFPVGTTTVTCTASDASPNSPDGTCTFTVTVNDTQAPTVTCPANITAPNAANQCSAAVTYTTPTGTDNCPGVVTVSCVPASGSTFPVGVTTVTCTASDVSANSPDGTCTFTVTIQDTQAPAVTCPANISTPAAAGQCSAVVSYTTPTATDNCPGATVSCVPASGSSFPVGTTTVTCTASDASPNSPNTTCSFTVTVNDTQVPTLTCPANITVVESPPSSGSATVTYTVPTASDNCPGATVVCVPASGSSFAVGTTTVTCTATDASANTGACTFTITVQPACTITCPANVTVANTTGQCGATVNYPAPTTTGVCGTVTCTPASGSFFAVGTTTVNCSTTSGPTCSFTVTVQDTQAPVANCPAPITVPNAAGQCSAVVSYSATASDNCPGATIACVPASGSTFPVGTTTVTCTASDASPNSPDGTCSFSVTVQDTQAPAITCPANMTVPKTPGQCSTVVNYTVPTPTDNCPGATASCTPASGSTFPVGVTTVTCTATDASPNSPDTTCTFTITVTDTTAPVITCPANVTVPNDANVCGATVKFSDPTTSDNCPGTTVVCSPATGSLFPIGTTTVNCTATDASNNTSTCSFTVTVQDTQAPVATCPAPITTAAATGTCSAVVNYTATATDNCPGVTIVCAPASGSTFPVGVTTVNCTASDASPNSPDATCAFTVTVQDTQLPAITCPANITVTSNTTTGCTFTSVVNYPAPTATDNCGLASVVCVPPSGSTFNEGTTTVTCTATDTSGNTASCTFTVTVGAAFGFCSVDDATGNRFQMVVNPASPSYGVWRFTVVATNTTYCGKANYVSYIPGVKLRAYDNDYSAENPTYFMDANFKGTTGTVTVRNVSGTVRLTLRDRNLLDSVCP